MSVLGEHGDRGQRAHRSVAPLRHDQVPRVASQDGGDLPFIGGRSDLQRTVVGTLQGGDHPGGVLGGQGNEKHAQSVHGVRG